MNVAELIAQLEEIVDKSKPVTVCPAVADYVGTVYRKIRTEDRPVLAVEEFPDAVCLWRKVT